jgi:hypothetical protein
MVLKIAVVVMLILGALAGFVATRPSEFRVTRSRAVAAPPDVVHAYVNDFARWPEWSPWEKRDPAMKRDLSGAPAGTGALYHWSGNKEVSEGRMTITDSRPGQSITIRLEFIKPWAAANTTRFDFAPAGSGTNVTWTMAGCNNFVAKAFCLFMDMDKMVGGDFEKGLANLDTATAGPARAAASADTGAPSAR